MASRSLFFQLSSLSPQRIVEICERVRTQHRSGSDRVYNATLTSIAEPFSENLYFPQLDAIRPYLPGGALQCFDNAFIGSTWFPFSPDRYGLDKSQWYNHYAVWGGLMTSGYRWDQIFATARIWQKFKTYYSLPWMHFYCLAPETRVLTHDLQWTEVGKLAEGDKLIGFDEHRLPGERYRKYREANVTATGRRSMPCYEVTLADGSVIVASSDHKWLVRGDGGEARWTTTERLRPGTCALKLFDTWEPSASYEAGYLAGMLDGEGCLGSYEIPTGRRLALTLAQKENAALQRFEASAEQEGVPLGLDSFVRRTGVRSLRVTGGRREILRTLGSLRPPRLMKRWEEIGADSLGSVVDAERVEVLSIRYVGETEVVTLQTSTGTLIAEGYAHHNCDMEADLDALVHPTLGDDVIAGLEATLIQLCREAKAIEPHRSVQWSPFHWVQYNGNAELKARLGQMFRNVEDYSGMGINFLDLQDGVGARPGVKTRENSHALLDAIKDSFPFPHAGMNVEWFKATATGFEAYNAAEREDWYAARGSRVGTCWEARYWDEAQDFTPPSPTPLTIKFFTREQWGANPSLPRLGYYVPPARRTEVQIHHTASIDGNDSTPNRWSEFEAVRYARALQTARPDLGRDIPYNFLVGVNEAADTVFIFEGRGLYLTGAHTAGHNTAGLAWSFMGDGRNMDLKASKAFVDVVVNEVKYHRANAFPNLASVRSPSGGVFWGHRDSSPSKPHCPGPSIYPLIQSVQL